LLELLKDKLTKEQKITFLASWLGWSLDGYDFVLMLFVISSVNQLLHNPWTKTVGGRSKIVVFKRMDSGLGKSQDIFISLNV
jgi:hypothetical protein